MSGHDFSASEKCLIDDSDMENIRLHRAESMGPTEEVVIEKSRYETDKPQTDRDPVRLVGSTTRNLCAEVNYLKVEVVMFLYLFSYMMRSVTNTVLMMDKVCLVHLGRSDYDCAHLDSEDLLELKTEVEEMANNYHVGHGLLSMLPSAILSLFIGSWSDKYGRKAPMIAALTGVVIDGFGVTLCAHFYRSRVEYMYITASLAGVSGGFIAIFLVLYAYASDLSSIGNRTLRYALLEMAFALAMPLGGLAGGWIFKFFGFVPVFLTSTCGHVVALCWVIFMLEETKGLDNKDSWMTKFQAFWSLESFLGAFKATIKKRPNRAREQIWALILAMSISVFAFASTASVGFLYVHHLYDWDNTQYSTVNSVFTVMGAVVMLVLVPLSKKYNVRDVILGLVGSVSLVAKMICTGLAMDHHLYYLASLLGLFSGFGTLAGRSKISKITPNEDLGKVFAFLSSAESILPIVATAIISQVFNASLRFFPGLVYVVMGAVSVIPVLIFLWISRIPNANIDSKAEDQGTADTLPTPQSSQEREPAAKF